ncbi:MAG: hypothetical protein IT381_27240 [Deltaproteobacteria bacterium]|nr:hypothetical protein [Deltaproteobacteria bacterium]
MMPILLIAIVTHAAPSPLAKIEQAFEASRFEEAEVAITALDHATLAPQDRIRAAFLGFASSFYLGQKQKAAEWKRKVLALAPGFRLDPKEHPPQLIDAFSELTVAPEPRPDPTPPPPAALATTPATPAAPTHPARIAGFVVIGVGAAAAIAGVAMVIYGTGEATDLRERTVAYNNDPFRLGMTEKQLAVREAKLATLDAAAMITLGVGAAALVTGTVLAVKFASGAAVAVAPLGNGVVVAGAF